MQTQYTSKSVDGVDFAVLREASYAVKLFRAKDPNYIASLSDKAVKKSENLGFFDTYGIATICDFGIIAREIIKDIRHKSNRELDLEQSFGYELWKKYFNNGVKFYWSDTAVFYTTKEPKIIIADGFLLDKRASALLTNEDINLPDNCTIDDILNADKDIIYESSDGKVSNPIGFDGIRVLENYERNENQNYNASKPFNIAVFGSEETAEYFGEFIKRYFDSPLATVVSLIPEKRIRAENKPLKRVISIESNIRYIEINANTTQPQDERRIIAVLKNREELPKDAIEVTQHHSFYDGADEAINYLLSNRQGFTEKQKREIQELADSLRK